MATVGENIRRYRKAHGLSAARLGEMVGLTESAILHYERGIRTPGESQLEKIAHALNVSPRMLEDHRIESAKDLVGTLLQLEEEFGLVPDMCDGGLWIDPKAKNAQGMGRGSPPLDNGRDHPGGIRRMEEEVLREEKPISLV